jgi:hypothetical protein
MNQTELLVDSELNDFYDDSVEREQRIRLLLSWQSTATSCTLPTLQIGAPKKKFQPKTAVRIHKKTNDRGRNPTF